MQPTNVQVQASLAALALDRAAVDGAEGAVRLGNRGSVPDWLLEVCAAVPAERADRVVAARRRIEAGTIPSAEELAGRMVGRIVCDRLR